MLSQSRASTFCRPLTPFAAPYSFLMWTHALANSQAWLASSLFEGGALERSHPGRLAHQLLGSMNMTGNWRFQSPMGDYNLNLPREIAISVSSMLKSRFVSMTKEVTCPPYTITLTLYIHIHCSTYVYHIINKLV